MCAFVVKVSLKFIVFEVYDLFEGAYNGYLVVKALLSQFTKLPSESFDCSQNGIELSFDFGFGSVNDNE